MTALHKVFVYGTLKRGEPNHDWLSKKENGVHRFIGIGKTIEKYALVIATKYNIPFLLDQPGKGHIVDGEVYEVDDKMLGNLDILEDHPHFYVRRPTPILVDEKQEICWTYFIKNFKPELMKREMLTSYSSCGPHQLKYLERSSRDPNYCYIEEIISKQTRNDD